MYIVRNKSGELRNFRFYPKRGKRPIMIESKELEEDYHGHFYHPKIESGEYEDVWLVRIYDDLINPYDYGEEITNTEIFSDIIKNLQWEDCPIEY